MKSEEFVKDILAYCEADNVTGSLANISALLMDFCDNINWVGFYLYDGHRLRLGPFQGKVACTRIDMGRGVCGLAAQKRKSLVVDDVDQFDDHIVCDSASKSEVVVPIIQDNKLIGVLDVDSASKSRFGVSDQLFFENVVGELVKHLKFL